MVAIYIWLLFTYGCRRRAMLSFCQNNDHFSVFGNLYHYDETVRFIQDVRGLFGRFASG